MSFPETPEKPKPLISVYPVSGLGTDPSQPREECLPAALPSQWDASYKGEAASGASRAGPRSHISRDQVTTPARKPSCHLSSDPQFPLLADSVK